MGIQYKVAVNISLLNITTFTQQLYYLDSTYQATCPTDPPDYKIAATRPLILR